MTENDQIDTDVDGDDEPERKSKSQVKREMNALQDMGESLVALAPAILKQMSLSDDMLTATLDAQKIKSREAKRRQMQYLGVLMRQEDTEQLQRQLRDVLDGRQLSARSFHEVEAWRDKLVGGDDSVIDILIQRFRHNLDMQQLRQLIRNARKEKAPGVKSKRALFRFLKSLSDANPSDEA